MMTMRVMWGNQSERYFIGTKDTYTKMTLPVQGRVIVEYKILQGKVWNGWMQFLVSLSYVIMSSFPSTKLRLSVRKQMRLKLWNASLYDTTLVWFLSRWLVVHSVEFLNTQVDWIPYHVRKFLRGSLDVVGFGWIVQYYKYKELEKFQLNNWSCGLSDLIMKLLISSAYNSHSEFNLRNIDV